MAVHQSILDLIGNTPVVDVSKLSPNPDVKIYAKLENQNPAGSVKDRIAKSMVLQAEKQGLLKPGSTLIEPSSGNTGIALAMIASMRNYQLKIVLPQNVSIEKTIAGGLGRRDYSFSWRIGVQWSGETCPRTCNTKPRLGIPVPIWQRVKPSSAL